MLAGMEKEEMMLDYGNNNTIHEPLLANDVQLLATTNIDGANHIMTNHNNNNIMFNNIANTQVRIVNGNSRTWIHVFLLFGR